MRCQTKSAAKIVAEGVGYCLAVKGNQPTLHQGIKNFFPAQLENDFADTSVEGFHSTKTTHDRVGQFTTPGWRGELVVRLRDSSNASLGAVGTSKGPVRDKNKISVQQSYANHAGNTPAGGISMDWADSIPAFSVTLFKAFSDAAESKLSTPTAGPPWSDSRPTAI